jgi:hypothetical protein
MGVRDWGWDLLGWCEETTNTLIAGKFENHSSSIDFFKLTFVYGGTICFSSTIVIEQQLQGWECNSFDNLQASFKASCKLQPIEKLSC